jgi:hypothetical protein
MREIDVVRQVRTFLLEAGLAGHRVVDLYTDAHPTLREDSSLQPFQRFTLLLDGLTVHPDLVGRLSDGETTFVIEAKGGGPFLSLALREHLPFAQCLTAYYAVLDLRPFQERAGGVVTDAVLRAFSPVAYVEANTAPALPILIVRAGHDQPRLNVSIDVFVQAALAANLPIDVMNHPQGRHAIDILDDDDRSRELIARTVMFVRAHLGETKSNI